MKVPSLIRFLANKAQDVEKLVSTTSSIPNHRRKKHIYGFLPPEFKIIIKPNRNNNPVGTVDKITASERLRQKICKNNPSESVCPLHGIERDKIIFALMPLMPLALIPIVHIVGGFVFFLLLYWIFLIFL